MIDTPLPPPSNDLAAVHKWAIGVMATFGLNGWRFQFNRCKTSTGLCRGLHEIIELSVHLVERNPPAEVRETLLHEIAHALVGARHAHNAVWRAKCREVGCKPVRCGHADMPAGPWQAVCGGCGARFDRHNRPKRLHSLHCRRCGPDRGQLAWVKRSERVN